MSHGVIFYFEVHQPFRLRPYRISEIGYNHDYFWDEKNREIFERASMKCYRPMTTFLNEHEIKSNLSITGTFIEQALKYDPELIDIIKGYVSSGNCELIDETYYHSLVSLYDYDEFKEEVKEHNNIIKKLFNYEPKTFRNTELIYNDDVSYIVRDLGYKTILTEGFYPLIERYNPNYIYKSVSGLNLLLRNFMMSDDISFRFSNRSWPEYPLTADKFASWIIKSPGDVINLFMDYETFGEHQSAETGIFDFMKYLKKYMDYNNIETMLINDAVYRYEKHDTISIKNYVSWADKERNLNPWLGNDMQREAFEYLKSLKNKGDMKIWRYLNTSDHLYYMSTGSPEDQEVHNYFNPYKSPYIAFMNFMSVLRDFSNNF
ncbi:glycoside hydrolase family 57 protein [Picrophilus oshimae]|uniref:Alpha-amylase n=1 Tax=Picrophilus torridus (strain ATCC 700027 / DSM 9790 / JCM 10055 / NBRC 100828 / KAW 2/3) TaxID=1122961 RepID=A0A8G2L7G9_PICTO|nr:glycoside hydrolase family 57 protein [Picrophilus oshimae]SMD31107.1 alpha-amylase [Picrophilus oshimae DSM 9789]